ncbi:hypothetical protein GEV33_001454 [Tenebrio molitor]|uniref:Uncharacterized protein n=1 Tax=Tenebrio molitor TaxID=7067 RepID=A0A8J6HWB7_TENMO|nr:hypothetical protein GEV33_001454 [Tenebrio molitor]
MALSPVSLTLNKKSLSIRKICFYNNDEKTDMLLIYGECGKNSVAAADNRSTAICTPNSAGADARDREESRREGILCEVYKVGCIIYVAEGRHEKPLSNGNDEKGPLNFDSCRHANLSPRPGLRDSGALRQTIRSDNSDPPTGRPPIHRRYFSGFCACEPPPDVLTGRRYVRSSGRRRRRHQVDALMFNLTGAAPPADTQIKPG